MTTQLLDTEIRYSRATRDYDILVDGIAVASAANYHDAEAIRTKLIADRRVEGLYATVSELDGDPDDGGPEPWPERPVAFDRTLIPSADWGAYATGDLDDCACGEQAVMLLHGVHDTLDIALCSRCHTAYEATDVPWPLPSDTDPPGGDDGVPTPSALAVA